MSSSIKLWDIRMVKRLKRNDLRKSPLPADTIAVPSSLFARADIVSVEPSSLIQTRLTTGEGSLDFSEATFKDGSCVIGGVNKSSVVGSDHVITNLSAEKGLNCGLNNAGSALGGSLIVTAQSRTKSTRIEHFKLDLSGTTQVTRKICQTNPNLGCQPIYAIASSHKFMATCSNRNNINRNSFGDKPGASTRLCLYDLNETPNTISALTAVQPYSSPLKLRQQQREDQTYSFQVDSYLTDRHGAETELSCIAMNMNGTALVGGSTDGDLFVWRGI